MWFIRLSIIEFFNDIVLVSNFDNLARVKNNVETKVNTTFSPFTSVQGHNNSTFARLQRFSVFGNRYDMVISKSRLVKLVLL